MDTNILIAILGTGGLTAIVGAIITGLFSRRKLGAEATEIITKAAAGVVTQMQGRLDDQEKDRKRREDEHASEMFEARAEMARMREAHQAEMEEVRQVLQLHVAWDLIAIGEVKKLGIELPAPPPLLPPNRGIRLEV